jgi:hypothetical protein
MDSAKAMVRAVRAAAMTFLSFMSVLLLNATGILPLRQMAGHLLMAPLT